ncbi:MAG: amidohydrolase [Hyphomicrobiaceae bacterium]
MPAAADIIIENGPVLTMDDARPRAEAVAIRGNEILAVGSRADVLGLKAPHTRMIDARGGTVMPGLIEGHVHIFMGAGELDNLDLSGVHGLDQLTRAARSFADSRPEQKLVYANQGSYTVLDDHVLPTRHDLDKVMPDRPFAMMCYDHHTVFANTRALELAGILKGAPVPTGSEIVMGADGLATGELREPGAFRYILALTPTGGRDTLGFTEAADPDPAPTAEQRIVDRYVLLRGLEYCASFGITTVHNMDGNFYTLDLLAEIDAAGDFCLRCQSPFHYKNFRPLSQLEAASEMARRYTGERVSSGRVKLFMDGVLESWTALTLEDYPDKPGHHGDPNYTAEEFAAIAVEADRRGLQIDVHAIADGAIRRTLDGYEAAMKANGRRDSRHRIEHLETIHPDDVPRLAELGVLASIQPTHAPGAVFPLEPAMTRIRARDLPYAYPWRTIMNAGTRVLFNSDWPVAPIDPMISLHAALVRAPYRPGDPEHRLTRMEVLKGYTTWAAYAEFMEHRKGMLRPGMLADVAIFSADLETVDIERIEEAKAVATICDGRITHED